MTIKIILSKKLSPTNFPNHPENKHKSPSTFPSEKKKKNTHPKKPKASPDTNRQNYVHLHSLQRPPWNPSHHKLDELSLRQLESLVTSPGLQNEETSSHIYVYSLREMMVEPENMFNSTCLWSCCF